MSASDLVRYATNILFVLVFLATLAAAVREPRRPVVGAALLFGALAAVLVQGEVARALDLTLPPIAADLSVALIAAVPYLLLRVVSDLVRVPRTILLAALAGLGAITAGVLLTDAPLPLWLTLVLVLYFVGLQLYASVLLFLATRRSSGVPRQRSRAAVLGSLLLGIAVLIAGLQLLTGPLEAVTSATRLLALGSALAYYAGFAPPGILKRAWQEPELRSFLARVAEIPPNGEATAIIASLESAVASATGAAVARIAVRDEDRDGLVRPDSQALIGGALVSAFNSQRAILVDAGDLSDIGDIGADRTGDPVVRAAIAAPISARGRRLGAVVVGLPHVPLFAEDDLAFVQVLSDQAAQVFDATRLYQDLARANVRLQEATQAKTEFLANMSHELRTPMNAILGFSDLLAEQLRQQLSPAQERYLRNIKDAGEHLLALINEVLDLSKVEAGKVDIRREVVGLASLVEPVASAARAAAAARQIGFETDLPEDLAVHVDPARVRQVLYNLLSNAVKFTVPGARSPCAPP